jgi:hypothetical protein
MAMRSIVAGSSGVGTMSTSDDRITALEDQIRRLKRGDLFTTVLLLPCFFMSIYLFLFAMGGAQAGALPSSLRAEGFKVADPDIELSVASLGYDHISGAKLILDGLVVGEKKRGVSISPTRIKLRQNDWVDGAFAGGGVDLILIEVTDDGPRMTFRNQAGDVTGTFP